MEPGGPGTWQAGSPLGLGQAGSPRKAKGWSRESLWEEASLAVVQSRILMVWVEGPGQVPVQGQAWVRTQTQVRMKAHVQVQARVQTQAQAQEQARVRTQAQVRVKAQVGTKAQALEQAQV